MYMAMRKMTTVMLMIMMKMMPLINMVMTLFSISAVLRTMMMAMLLMLLALPLEVLVKRPVSLRKARIFKLLNMMLTASERNSGEICGECFA